MEFDLVFEGGGAKGMVFVGALQEFFARGHSPGRLLGTSAGAIAAALVAAGYDEQEMLDALNEKKDGISVFESFLGEPARSRRGDRQPARCDRRSPRSICPWCRRSAEEQVDKALVQSLLGVCPGSATSSPSSNAAAGTPQTRLSIGWRERLNSGDCQRVRPRDFGDMTLAEFHEATGVDFTVVAADTSASQHPDSQPPHGAGLPGRVGHAHVHEHSAALGRGGMAAGVGQAIRSNDITGHRVVDGGLLSGFPLALFVSADANVTNVMGEKRSPNVIGMLIDEFMPVPERRRPRSACPARTWTCARRAPPNG